MGRRPVVAVSLRPSQWQDGFCHHHKGALFVLPNCVDSNDAGNALFPETIRSEMHGARSVIEAYSRKATLSGREQASACGLLFDGKDAPVLVRALGPGRVWTTYKIDRWD